MADDKDQIEEECSALQQHLLDLTQSRDSLKKEFDKLSRISRTLQDELSEDSYDAEGHIHHFESEKQKLRSKLDELEKDIREKDRSIGDLDAKASDYLLRVSRASNVFFDEDQAEERNDDGGAEGSPSDEGTSQEDTDDSYEEDEEKGLPLSPPEGAAAPPPDETKELRTNEIEKRSSIASPGRILCNSNSYNEKENTEEEEAVSTPPLQESRAGDAPPAGGGGGEEGREKELSSMNDQMTLLSSLVSDLKQVKDDMGRYMTAKEKSFFDLEDQLSTTNLELTNLKETMTSLSAGLQHKEERFSFSEERNHRRISDIEDLLKEVQGMANRSSMVEDEKEGLLQKMESLKGLLEDYYDSVNVSGIDLDLDSEDEDEDSLEDEKEVTLVKAGHGGPLQENQKDIYLLEDSVKVLENQSRDLNEKLRKTGRHLKVLSREREVKQKECEILQTKVEVIEASMRKLQGTFDALVRAVMGERDELLKEVEGKTLNLQLLQENLSATERRLADEASVLVTQKAALQKELEKYKTGEVVGDTSCWVRRAEYDMGLKEKEKALDAVRLDKSVVEGELRRRDDAITNLKKKLEERVPRSDYESLLQEKERSELEQQKRVEELKLELECRSGELSLLQGEVNALREEKVKAEESLESEKELNMEYHRKCSEVVDLEDKVSLVRGEMSEFVSSLKEEMNRLKEEAFRALAAKESVEQVFSGLQKDHQELLEEHQSCEAAKEHLRKELLSMEESLQALKAQLADAESQMGAVNARVTALTSEGRLKEREYQEELTAREATIQELRVTLVNNQKQSMENYHALQDDMAALELRFKKELKDVVARGQQAEEGRLRALEDGQNETERLEGKIRDLEEEKARLGEELKAASLPPPPPDEGTKAPEGGDAEQHSEYELELLRRQQELEDELEEVLDKLEKQDVCLQVSPEMHELQEKNRSLEALVEKLKGDVEAKDRLMKETRAFATQVEFEALIASKEEENLSLEGKVLRLEESLVARKSYLKELEAQLELVSPDSKQFELLKATVDQQLEEIRDLNLQLASLKEELEKSYRERAGAGVRDESCAMELDAAPSGSGAPSPRNDDSISEDECSADLELKKNLVKRLKAELSAELGLEQSKADLVHVVLVRNVDVASRYYIGRIKELNRYIRVKSDAVEKHVIALLQEKQRLLKECRDCKAKSSECLDRITVLEDEVNSLTSSNKAANEELGRLREVLRQERDAAIEMQNAMVSDLEGLVLKLEGENKALQAEVDLLKKSSSPEVKCEPEKVKDDLPNLEEQPCLDALQATISSLEKKLRNEESRQAQLLKEAEERHLLQVKELRRDIQEEIDILEQRKEDAVLEVQNELAALRQRHREEVEEVRRRYEARITEDKADFGRVLVAKIASHEQELNGLQEELALEQKEAVDLRARFAEQEELLQEAEYRLQEMFDCKSCLLKQLQEMQQVISGEEARREASFSRQCPQQDFLPPPGRLPRGHAPPSPFEVRPSRSLGQVSPRFT